MDRNSVLLFFGLLACFASSSDAIVGGILSPPNRFRYHVTLEIHGEGHVCGGAIIDDQHILTAAYCILRRNKFVDRLSIIAGTNDIQQTAPPAQTIEVWKAYVPKQYRQRPGVNDRFGDIAVLRLKNKLNMDIPHRPLGKVNLPVNNLVDYYDKNGTITGFGWDWIMGNGQGGNVQTQLRHAVASVRGLFLCRTVVHTVHVSENHVCARIIPNAPGPHGVCDHDIGGPLVFEGTVIGVLIQKTNDCSEAIIPAVYTRVGAYIYFIDDVLHDKKNRDIRIHDFSANSS